MEATKLHRNQTNANTEKEQSNLLGIGSVGRGRNSCCLFEIAYVDPNPVQLSAVLRRVEREREVTVVQSLRIAVHLTYHPHAISLGKDQNNPILVPITSDTLIITKSKQHSRGVSIYINNGSSKSGRSSTMGKIQEKFELCP
jgi:hypothetical protein